MLWNEDLSLDVAPGQHSRPESLLFDQYAEELSFPAIYFGVARDIRSSGAESVRSTAYSMCTSEIRRTDRRGVTPHHVLYMAMKILRFRVRDGILPSRLRRPQTAVQHPLKLNHTSSLDRTT